MSSHETASESPKRALYAQFALIARAAGHPHRLELLELMAQGERSVEALAAAAGLSVANASQHLQSLRRAGLAAARKSGKQVFYHLADDAALALTASLRRIAERNLAEVGRVVAGYFRRRDALEPVKPSDLLKRLKRGEVTVLDVRPPEEFAAGHLPGALNIPLKELRRRLDELPKRREVVAYCRGPYCVLAWEAVAALRGAGRKARRLADGFPEWRAAGLPVEAA